MSAHRCDGGALPAMLAIPAVPIVKDHVHARRILRQIIHSKKLQYGGAFSAFAARIELANAHELRRLSHPHTIPNGRSHHCWKSVEVSHRNSL